MALLFYRKGHGQRHAWLHSRASQGCNRILGSVWFWHPRKFSGNPCYCAFRHWVVHVQKNCFCSSSNEIWFNEDTKGTDTLKVSVHFWAPDNHMFLGDSAGWPGLVTVWGWLWRYTLDSGQPIQGAMACKLSAVILSSPGIEQPSSGP